MSFFIYMYDVPEERNNGTALLQKSYTVFGMVK